MARTRRRKRRTHVPENVDPSKKGPPKSFVFWRGQYGLTLRDLEGDLRKMMQPHTATNLKESKRNQLKDFVHVAGPLGVSQFLILTATENASYLRIAKVPRGPTLTLRIHSYSLIRDVVRSQQRPRLPDSLWKAAPLVVLTGFAGQEHLKLAAALFQNLFPAINVKTARLATCQRVVLLSYDRAADRMHLRQFSVRVQPSGVTKGVKQLVGRRQVPDLGGCADVAEFLTKAGYGSESEGEEAASSRVTLAQDMGRGNHAARQSRVLLQEIGPRLELEVVKAEEGLCGGAVLYHSKLSKSPAEAAAQAQAIRQREQLKQQRRSQQEANLARKACQKRGKGGEGESGEGPAKRRKKQPWWEAEPGGGKAAVPEDDDAEYYRQEVGQEPDELTLTGGRGKRQRGAAVGGRPGKSGGRQPSRSPGGAAGEQPRGAKGPGRGRGGGRDGGGRLAAKGGVGKPGGKAAGVRIKPKERAQRGRK